MIKSPTRFAAILLRRIVCCPRKLVSTKSSHRISRVCGKIKNHSRESLDKVAVSQSKAFQFLPSSDNVRGNFFWTYAKRIYVTRMKIDFIELLTIFHSFKIFPVDTEPREVFIPGSVVRAERNLDWQSSHRRYCCFNASLKCYCWWFKSSRLPIGLVGAQFNQLSDVTHAKSIKACHTRLHVDDSQTGVKHFRDKKNHWNVN